MKIEKEKSLSEKRYFNGENDEDYIYQEEDVKEKIQNAQKRLKENKIAVDIEGMNERVIVVPLIILDKIFLEEFGDKLI